MAEGPARILFATQELAAGGPDRVLFELLQHLPRDRFAPSLAVIEPGGRYFERLRKDLPVFVTGGGRYPVRRVAHLIDAERPDLVFTTLRMNVAAAAALYLARHRPPLIARQANHLSADYAILKHKSLVKHRLAHRAIRHLLRRADAVVAQSIDMADDLRPVLRRGQRLATIGNPVDPLALRAAAASESRTLPGSPRLLAVGRLMPQKGFDLLVEAMPAVVARHPEAVLTVIGEGPDRALLERRIAALGLGDRVQLPGWDANPLAAMAAADLLVSASRYEGFPNVVLEAMAIGCAVVGTACPGATAELVVEGETGWLAAPDDPGALAAAILRALDGDRAAAIAGASALVAERYATPAIVARYSDLFDTVLAETRR